MTRQKLIKHKKDCIYYYVDTDKKKKFAYRYKYYDVHGVRKEKTKQGFLSDIEAERALINVKAAVLDGNDYQVTHSNMTYTQWFALWFEAKVKKIKVSTARGYKQHYDQYFKPLIGHYKLNQLTKMTVQKHLVDVLIDRGLKEKTIRNTIITLNTTLIAAVEEGILERRRFKSLDLRGAVPNRIKNTIPEDELNFILKELKKEKVQNRYYTILTIAMTGMRRGECMGLKWEDVDFENKTISINRTRDDMGTRSPKTKNSIRTFKVDDFLFEELKVYQIWCKQEQLKLGKTVEATDFVFINASGVPLCYAYPADALRRVVMKNQLSSITIHSLRHTFASVLIGKGIPIPTVAKMMGDTSEVVMKVYAHSISEKEDEAIKIMKNLVNFD